MLVKNITNLLQYLATTKELTEIINEQKKARGEQLTYPVNSETEKLIFIEKVKAFKCDNLSEKLETLKNEGFDISEKKEVKTK